ncbi:uncharacterized protein CDAR_220261 [Caerostris darwini]|uniref:Uncharacterized protein n=1 Tax=Caerostris darwini TaxID=1538125 RepID=A0AAV4R4J0_9ARAC|nr:uncharacterized protein CDAR_220261 [Caerostris darwini]
MPSLEIFDPNYRAITEEALKKRIHPLEPEDLKYLDNFDDPDMSIEEKLQSLQSLSLPEEQRWMEAEHTAFISRKIQGIVQAFQYRADMVKEKLVQPPTPSPSPPLESSSDNDPISPIHQSRPRLQSLIEEEKSSIDSWSQTISFYCCSIRKKLIPTFPRIIDPQSFLSNVWTTSQYSSRLITLQTSSTLLTLPCLKVRLQFLHNGFWVEDYKKTKANYFRKRDFKVQTFWEFFNRVDAVTKTPYVIR